MRSLLVVTLVLVTAPGVPAAAGVLHVPADHPTIQAAVDAAVPGDLIQIAPGRYAENVVVTTDGLALRGGPAAILDGRYLGPCITVEAEAFAVQGLRLVNGTTGFTGNGTLMVAADLHVEACSGAGLDLAGDMAVVGRCRITGCGGDGLHLQAQTVENIAVVGLNRMERCGGDGIHLSGPATFYLVKNRCTGNAGDGLRLEVTDPGVSDPSRLLQNRCEDNGGRGLYVDTTGGAVVERTVARRNGGHGLHVRGIGVGVDLSRADGNRGAGVLLEALGGSTAERNACRDNAGEGLVLALAEGGSGQNAAVRNLLRGNARDGLRVAGGSAMVLDNRCLLNLGDGLQVDAAVPDCGLYRNAALRNGHEGLDNRGAGTRLDEGNVLKGNGGLDLAGAGTGDGLLTISGASTWLTGGASATQSLDL